MEDEAVVVTGQGKMPGLAGFSGPKPPQLGDFEGFLEMVRPMCSPQAEAHSQPGGHSPKHWLLVAHL